MTGRLTQARIIKMNKSFISSTLVFAASAMFSMDAMSYEDHLVKKDPEQAVRVMFDDGQRVIRIYGETAELAEGDVETWISFNRRGFHKIGVTLSPGALNVSALPQSDDMFIHYDAHLDLPKLPGSPFNHMYFSYNPHGHDPSGIYNKGHFDLHWAFIEPEALAGIQFEDPAGQILPPVNFMPNNVIAQTFPDGTYVNVPGQGVHWYYDDAAEWNGGEFTETYLWGSFNGEATFMEPMITYESITTIENFEKEIQLPLCVKKTGYYPKKYGWNTKYNDEGDKTIVAYMSDFVLKRRRASGCR